MSREIQKKGIWKMDTGNVNTAKTKKNSVLFVIIIIVSVILILAVFLAVFV